MTTFKIDNALNGIAFFHSVMCEVCKKQNELLTLSNIPFISIECDNDPNYFIEHHNIDILPEIRIYEKGEVVWSKINLISEQDLQFLRNYVGIN